MLKLMAESSIYVFLKRYDFRVDDNFKTRWMENAADEIVEFVEFMDELVSSDIPQTAVV